MRHVFVAFILGALGMAGLAGLTAGPAGAATVSIVPPDTAVVIGSTFTLRVVTDAVTDLQAYQLIYGFDSGVIQFLGASPGEVLTGSGFSYSGFVLPDHVAPVDSVWYDAAILGGSTSGAGVLVYLQFKALTVGIAHVNCLHVEFRDSQNDPTFPACVGGRVVVVGITDSKEHTWGRLRRMYR